MRIKSVIFLFFILGSQLLPGKCLAQLIDNKLSLHIEKVIGSFQGKQLVHDGNFVYPSLFNNYNHIEGYSLDATWKMGKNISVGLSSSYLNSSEWKYSDKPVYAGSESKIIAFAPLLQLHTAFRSSGIFNRTKVYVNFMPVAGFLQLKIANPIFDLETKNGRFIPATSSSDPFYGLQGGMGIEFALNQNLGLTGSYICQKSWIKSILYNDTHLMNTQLKFGVVIKLFKDKYYLYR